MCLLLKLTTGLVLKLSLSKGQLSVISEPGQLRRRRPTCIKLKLKLLIEKVKNVSTIKDIVATTQLYGVWGVFRFILTGYAYPHL